MNGLLRICEDHGIDIEYVRLVPDRGLLGWYCADWDTGQPLILLDDSLPNNPRLHRLVLAEEVGHHMVGVRRLGDSAVRWQNEHRAMRWAVDYLIPTPRLAEAAERGLHLSHELAEWFDVPEWIVWRKFHALKQDLRERHNLRVPTSDILSSLLVDVLRQEAV